jgi:peptidoglycan/LPS O-acetylase OafA/YrhL
MELSQIYVLISIIVLLIIFILLFFVGKNNKNKKQKTLTPLAGLAFGFIIAGIIFGDNRWLGYSLIGIGVLLAVIDMLIKLKDNKKKKEVKE